MQTLKEWAALCEFVSKEYTAGSVRDYVDSPGNVKVIFKHDVECDPLRALKMAEIENRFGIKATYYFQADVAFNNWGVLDKIASLNHEIAYHYDVMDSQFGNIYLAMEEFDSNIKKFKSMGYEVTTVCPHGNPLMKREGWSSNKDFFRSSTVVDKYPNILDIVVQSDDIFSEKPHYITDAGYSWKLVAAINENDRVKTEDRELDSISEYIRGESASVVIISSHPHRWLSSSIHLMSKKIIFKVLRKLSRLLSKIPFLYTFLSKFYFLARRF